MVVVSLKLMYHSGSRYTVLWSVVQCGSCLLLSTFNVFVIIQTVNSSSPGSQGVSPHYLQNYIFCETFIQTFSNANTFDIPAMQNKNLKYVFGESGECVILSFVSDQHEKRGTEAQDQISV